MPLDHVLHLGVDVLVSRRHHEPRATRADRLVVRDRHLDAELAFVVRALAGEVRERGVTAVAGARVRLTSLTNSSSFAATRSRPPGSSFTTHQRVVPWTLLFLIGPSRCVRDQALTPGYRLLAGYLDRD